LSVLLALPPCFLWLCDRQKKATRRVRLYPSYCLGRQNQVLMILRVDDLEGGRSIGLLPLRRRRRTPIRRPFALVTVEHPVTLLNWADLCHDSTRPSKLHRVGMTSPGKLSSAVPILRVASGPASYLTGWHNAWPARTPMFAAITPSLWGVIYWPLRSSVKVGWGTRKATQC